MKNFYAPLPRIPLGFAAAPGVDDFPVPSAPVLLDQPVACPAAPAAVVPMEMRAALRRTIRCCSALSDLDIPQRRPVLGDWFMEGDLGFVFAPRGLGKTWLSLAMATGIATGRSCGPWQAAQPRRVLYVDGEMPCEALRERIAGMGGEESVSVLNHEALFLVGGRVLNFGDPDTQAALTEQMLADGVEVLFLDNLSCLFSGVKENDADAWEGVLSWLLTLRRHRIAVVLVHHSGRNKEMRGTSRREDAAFWVVRLEEASREGEREGARFVSRFTKDRNSRREQPGVEWNFRTDPSGRVSVGTQPAEGVDVFRQWIEDGLTSAEDIAREMGTSKGTVSRLAKRAMAEGWLRKNGREYVLVRD